MAGLLDGMAALVTGGASGIGRGVVTRYLREGATVVVLDTNPAALADIDDPALVVVEGDVRRWPDHVAAVEAVLDRAGHLDVLVANAGIADGWQHLCSTGGEVLGSLVNEVLDVNVTGMVLAARASAEALVRSQGSIICTLSNAATAPGGGGVAYTASKHACLGVMRQLAFELAPHVRVNGVAPGGTVDADLRNASVLGPGPDGRGGQVNPASGLADILRAVTPLQVPATPADHAGAYVYLAQRSEGLAVTGTVIRSDGGLSVRGIKSIRGGDHLDHRVPSQETIT